MNYDRHSVGPLYAIYSHLILYLLLFFPYFRYNTNEEKQAATTFSISLIYFILHNWNWILHNTTGCNKNCQFIRKNKCTSFCIHFRTYLFLNNCVIHCHTVAYIHTVTCCHLTCNDNNHTFRRSLLEHMLSLYSLLLYVSSNV